MTVRNLMACIMALSLFSASAHVLSPEEALSRLDYAALSTKSFSIKPVLNYTVSDKDGEPAVYIFDNGDGFLIVSAEDSAIPLLGYSDSGKFESGEIIPALDNWLKGYADQIRYIRENNYPSFRPDSRSSLKGLSEIPPLLKTRWNQGTPYNQYCFVINADGDKTQSVTGCVATAMAQVMNYFQYPEIGKGEISYSHPGSGTYSMNFGEQPFDWNLMKDTYYPDTYSNEEGDAVAYLMKACGYSVKMDYSKGESGANGANIPAALIDYFYYYNGISLQTRKYWTYDEWTQMIYDNLKEIGPVIYDGSALDGGHSFICDGYDGKGYFHFNWGWGGLADGYFLTDALNPDEYGIGGSAGGYNLGQQAIFSISSREVSSIKTRLMQNGSLYGKIDGSILSFELKDASDAGFQYINPLAVKVTFGVMVEQANNPDSEIQYFESDRKDVECKQSDFFRWDEINQTIDLNKVDMATDEEYNFIIATYIELPSDSYWSEVKAYPDLYNYVTVVKTEEGYEIKNHEIINMEVNGFKVESGTIYQDLPVKFSAGFYNPSSVQLSRNYSAVFFNSEGEKCFTMENYGVTVDAGMTEQLDWTSINWYKEEAGSEITEATDFTLKLYDNWKGEYVTGTDIQVTVLPKPEHADITLQLDLPDAELSEGIYHLSSTSFEISASLKVNSGYFSQPVNLDIEVPMENGRYCSVESKRFDTIPTLSEGEEQTLTMTMDFLNAVDGTLYHLQAWSNGEAVGKYLNVIFDTENGGITTLSPDSDGYYKVYSVSGAEILNTKDLEKVISLPSGIYIINGYKLKI